MERLNLCKEVLENAIGVYKNSDKCFEEGLAPLEMVSLQAIEELLEYRQLEEQGLLLQLPCKMGNKLYTVEEWLDTRELSILKYTFNGIERAGYRLMYEDNEEDITVFGFDEIGKTVFLSKSEAEQALERR